MKRHFGKWLTAAALAVGCTVMTANAFADTDGHWAESAINKWSWWASGAPAPAA